VTWEQVPGHVSASEAHGETTIVVERDALVEACEHLRDEHGFNFLSDITPTDYLGWGDTGVSGYIGTATGRDLNTPMTQGYQRLPQPKPKRFAMNYHLLALRRGDGRILRVQVWLDDGESVPSVVGVWPTADWHEREAWDLMGIPIENHPNHRRILMDDDWEGHPLRKDYPIGGEPVRFSDAE
jgi:NADH-quinone oxidoreductase subunit C